MLVTKQFMIPIDFHSMEENTMEVNGYRQLFGYQDSSKYNRLCSTEVRNPHRRCVNNDRIEPSLKYNFTPLLEKKVLWGSI